MKRFLALLTALACTLSPAIADNPKADAKAVVTSGNARFTVLTPQLIRMEWSADGQFEDRATLTFVNRETPVPEFKVRESKSKLTITTPALTLTYLKNGKFSDKNLKAVFTLNGKEVVWTPGMENPQNLLGTTRTLDGADGSKLKEPMEQGILSRAGWSLIDDSQRHVLTPDGSEWEEWVEARPEGDRQDLYLFAYGHDYKQALADYALVAGRAPMPPKYTLGYWWSRYWQYSDNEFVDLVNKLKSMDVPIDVLIVDMDWHETWGLRKSNSPKDEYGQRIGWTGYTWQKELFPSPANFLKWTENEELKVALNLHPASGIQPYEAVYDDFTKEYGWSEKGKSVPFKIDERKWADAYFKTVLEPMERDGVDFWWLDWQQWKESKYTPGLSNTFWLNHTFFNHAERQNPGLRPFIYHRWGGLGSHRYPLAFSGDTYATWPMLAYLPYFTATASNVNYGWWGHDIGGHMFGYRDEELEVRWYQLGAFSPINRLHSTDSPFNGKEPWNFHGDAERAMTSALRLRHAMIPYLYTMNRRAAFDNEPLVQPLYWDYPEIEAAYKLTDEFRFGTELLVAPIVDPAERSVQRAKADVWLPQGEWFDFFDGRHYTSRPAEGRRLEAWRDLDRMPVFAKPGAIVPLQMPAEGEALNSVANPRALQVVVFPGAENSFTLWEDDGAAQSKDRWASTEMALRFEGDSAQFSIAPAEGATDVIPASRDWTVTFRGIAPEAMHAVRATVDGSAAAPEVAYDAETLSLTVTLRDVPTSAAIAIDFADGLAVADDPVEADAFAVMKDAQMLYMTKEHAYRAIRELGKDALPVLSTLEDLHGVGAQTKYQSHMPQPVIQALAEVLTRN